MVGTGRTILVDFHAFCQGVTVQGSKRVLTSFTLKQFDVQPERVQILVVATKRKTVTAQQGGFQGEVLKLREIVLSFRVALLGTGPKFKKVLGLAIPLFGLFLGKPENFPLL